jgi:hypothetical protein
VSRVPTIAVDFDGVIHSYTSGWQGAHVIPDPPVPGAIDFLAYLSADGTPANVVIFSSRAKTWRGRRAMKAWLCEHSGGLWDECMGNPGIQSIKVTATKPVASVYLDDRAVRFDGSFPSDGKGVRAMLELQPWWKTGAD